jgi:hypothetical protein
MPKRTGAEVDDPYIKESYRDDVGAVSSHLTAQLAVALTVADLGKP